MNRGAEGFRLSLAASGRRVLVAHILDSLQEGAHWTIPMSVQDAVQSTIERPPATSISLGLSEEKWES